MRPLPDVVLVSLALALAAPASAATPDLSTLRAVGKLKPGPGGARGLKGSPSTKGMHSASKGALWVYYEPTAGRIHELGVRFPYGKQPGGLPKTQAATLLALGDLARALAKQPLTSEARARLDALAEGRVLTRTRDGATLVVDPALGLAVELGCSAGDCTVRVHWDGPEARSPVARWGTAPGLLDGLDADAPLGWTRSRQGSVAVVRAGKKGPWMAVTRWAAPKQVVWPDLVAATLKALAPACGALTHRGDIGGHNPKHRAWELPVLCGKGRAARAVTVTVFHDRQGETLTAALGVGVSQGAVRQLAGSLRPPKPTWRSARRRSPASKADRPAVVHGPLAMAGTGLTVDLPGDDRTFWGSVSVAGHGAVRDGLGRYYKNGRFIHTRELVGGAHCSERRSLDPAVFDVDVSSWLSPSYARYARLEPMAMEVTTVTGTKRSQGFMATLCVRTRNEGVYLRTFLADRAEPQKARRELYERLDLWDELFQSLAEAAARGPFGDPRPLRSKALTFEAPPGPVDLGAIRVEQPGDGRVWAGGTLTPPHLGDAPGVQPLLGVALPALAELEIAFEPSSAKDCPKALQVLAKRAPKATKTSVVKAPSGLDGAFQGGALASEGGGAWGLSACAALPSGVTLLHAWDTRPLPPARELVAALNAAAKGLASYDPGDALVAAAPASAKAAGKPKQMVGGIKDLDTPEGRRQRAEVERRKRERERKRGAPLKTLAANEQKAEGCIRTILYCYASLRSCLNLRCDQPGWSALVRVAERVSAAKSDMGGRVVPYSRGADALRQLEALPSALKRTPEYDLVMAAARLVASPQAGQSWDLQRALGEAMLRAADHRGGTYASSLTYRGREKVALATRMTTAPTLYRGSSRGKPSWSSTRQWMDDYFAKQAKHSQRLHQDHMRRLQRQYDADFNRRMKLRRSR